jgi:ABC-type nitrate/sulfonate/bicarbonate transport system substrate-binding protein
VSLEIEEAHRRADLAQHGSGPLTAARLAVQIRRNVERRDFFGGIRIVHQADGLVIVPDVAPDVLGLQFNHRGAFQPSSNRGLCADTGSSRGQKPRRRTSITPAAAAWLLSSDILANVVPEQPAAGSSLGNLTRDGNSISLRRSQSVPPIMQLRLAHYRNRFSMFRTYYALGAGLITADGNRVSVIEVPDPPSRELEECLIRGDVDFANVYLPNFLERALAGAPIIGLSTEWKSTGKGNGLFVRRGEIKHPKELEGRLIATHQGRHAIHQYLLAHAYGVDPARLQWRASPQETLLGVLRRGEASAVVLLDQFFHHGEQAPDVECLYTDGSAWKELTGFDEMIKHMIAANEAMIRKTPEIRAVMLDAVRESFAYSERNIEEVADLFIAAYGGDREALLTSARYPRMTFTFTESEQRLAQRQMDMFVEVGRLPRNAAVKDFFVV